jgi:hypothetical protein
MTPRSTEFSVVKNGAVPRPSSRGLADTLPRPTRSAKIYAWGTIHDVVGVSIGRPA